MPFGALAGFGVIDNEAVVLTSTAANVWTGNCLSGEPVYMETVQLPIASKVGAPASSTHSTVNGWPPRKVSSAVGWDIASLPKALEVRARTRVVRKSMAGLG